jgi:hypothetical protein
MCLNWSFSEQKNIKGVTYFRGFKAFLLPQIAEHAKGRIIYQLDKELTSLPNICGASNESYFSGFHIFPNRIDAEKYFDRYKEDYYESEVLESIVCPVYYREMVGVGLNGNYWGQQIKSVSTGLCILSKYLYIQSEDWTKALQNVIINNQEK